jgi:plasmid stabilization system protein ParE
MRQVVLAARAEAELDLACAWWEEHRSPEQARRWYENARRVLAALSDDAERYPHAEENKHYPYELRQVNFGLGSRPSHRAVFTIRGEMVLVLRIRHAAQDSIGPE